jgi:hypothetical protein
MSRAVYTFTNKENNQIADVVEFDLLDNPGCRAWQYAVLLNNKSKIIFKKNAVAFTTVIPSDINDQYAHLKSIIDQLSTTEFKTDLCIPESFDLTALSSEHSYSGASPILGNGLNASFINTTALPLTKGT